ncbi:MAG: cephalosporin hydroxylase family protein [Patescibacteria group bacterium]|nr:cephalosporin hydroxylase family protein [Patescibacteria group bacterium]
MHTKLFFPTGKEMKNLRKHVLFEPKKNLKQIRRSASVWLKAHWENKLSYEINWLGIPIIQSAEDMVILQEIIYNVKPDIIIETGVAHGGSLIYYASILELLNKGRVIGIDIEIRKHNKRLILKHPMSKRIVLIEGSSIDNKIAEKVKKYIKKKDKVLVILDSDHTRKHVLKELEIYNKFVTKGSYIIVEDTIMPQVANYKHAKNHYKTDNAKMAVDIFLENNSKFKIDRTWEKLGFTYFPGGFLKKIA